MVLQLVEKYASRDPERYARVENFIAEANGLIVEYVEFSYNELEAIIDDLNAMYRADDRPEAFENVNSFGIYNNRVAVWLIVCNEEEVARFRETVLGSPMIAFMNSDDLTEFLDMNNAYPTVADSIAHYWAFMVLPGIVLLALVAILLWRVKRRWSECAATCSASCSNGALKSG